MVLINEPTPGVVTALQHKLDAADTFEDCFEMLNEVTLIGKYEQDLLTAAHEKMMSLTHTTGQWLTIYSQASGSLPIERYP